MFCTYQHAQRIPKNGHPELRWYASATITTVCTACICLHCNLAVYPGETRCAIKVHAVRRHVMSNMQLCKRHGIWCSAMEKGACLQPYQKELTLGQMAINNRVHTHHALSVVIVFVAQHIIAIQVVPRVQRSTVHICDKERCRQQSTVIRLTSPGGMGVRVWRCPCKRLLKSTSWT